ncbi:MAG: hypothetical protein ABR611_16510, partial [Chthoniobacterales bacterium]
SSMVHRPDGRGLAGVCYIADLYTCDFADQLQDAQFRGVSRYFGDRRNLSPVSMSADGKLWVVEMEDYPNGLDGRGKPGGRIKFLEDTDGDGKADERRVLFTGWGMRDTHSGPNNLQYGLDNWLYGMVGYSGFDGTVGGKRHSFRQGMFRFRPDGSALEFLRSTSNNSWG